MPFVGVRNENYEDGSSHSKIYLIMPFCLVYKEIKANESEWFVLSVEGKTEGRADISLSVLCGKE